jgi:peptidoglycan/LPS O-acetylase OafA/YrhL
MMRGAAALAVAAGHTRGLFFADMAQVHGPSLPLKLLYGATSLGHQAVVVFFVLSGFLIGKSVLRSWQAGEWSWRAYLINRGSRLYVVLIPALLLTAGFDWAGSHLSSGGWVYRTILGNFGAAPFAANYTLPALLGSAAFLNTIITPCFGSNGPLWSLANEFWYYLLFPALVCVIRLRSAARERLAYACLLGAVLWFVGRSISLYFLIWLMGALVAKLTLSARRRWGEGLALASAGLAAACGVAFWAGDQAAISDFVLGAAVSALVWLAWSNRDFGVTGAYRWTAGVFAGFSYTLYATHFPLLVLLRADLLPKERWQPSFASLVFASAVLAGVLLFAYAVSRVTEARTESVRNMALAFLAPQRGRVREGLPGRNCVNPVADAGQEVKS